MPSDPPPPAPPPPPQGPATPSGPRGGDDQGAPRGGHDPGDHDPGDHDPGDHDRGDHDRGGHDDLGAPGAPVSSRFAQPRRLHPASVVLGVNVRQLVQAFLFPAAATFAAGGRTMLVALVLAGIVGLTVRILAWQRFAFSFDGEVLRVSEGVLSRNQRSLDVARIQQVEIDRSFLQRLVGLAALRVETAGSSADVEVELRVVPESDAVALRSAVRESKVALTGQRPVSEGAPGEEEPTAQPVLRVPLGHVVLGAVTGVRLLVFPALIAGAFQFVSQATDDWVERSVAYLIEQGVLSGRGVPGLTLGTGLLVALGVLVLSLVTAVVVGILRDAHFRIEQVDEDLHVSRGLLSTRDSVLPLRRIQLVQVQRNWIRRPLGYSSVRILSAGGSGDTDRRVTVPLLPDGDVDALLRAVYPGSAGLPALAGHPRAAVRRAVFRWVRSVSVPLIALWLIPWELAQAARLPALALLPLAVVLGIVEYRHLAHGLDDRLVAARQGALSVTTSLAPLVKVQAVSTRANYFQRRLALVTVRAHVAGPGGDVEVLDCGAERGGELHTRLTRHAADPTSIEPDREETAPAP